jgi:transglutaminase-like putative cysteine protease
MYSLLPGSGGIGENVEGWVGVDGAGALVSPGAKGPTKLCGTEGWVGVDGAGALVSPGRKGPTKFQDITVNEHTPLCSLEFHAEN